MHSDDSNEDSNLILPIVESFIDPPSESSSESSSSEPSSESSSSKASSESSSSKASSESSLIIFSDSESTNDTETSKSSSSSDSSYIEFIDNAVNNKLFMNCSMCDKFYKYSFTIIKSLRLLNKKSNDILKNIKYNNSYYNISEMIIDILTTNKNTILIEFINILKKKDITQENYKENTKHWKRKQRQKNKKKI